MQQDSKYIPSLRFDFLTPFYDPLQKLCFPGTKAEINLIRQSKIKTGSRVLDIGCGTATLTILLKKNQPDATVIGLDSDPRVLEIAKKKAVNANVNIQFENGFSDNLPFDDESFDVVFSNLMFHHLDRQKKMETLSEVYRVLCPEGEFHVSDWGKPDNTLMRLAFLPVQLLDGFESTSDNVKGLLPNLFQNSSFSNFEEVKKLTTIFGTFYLYKLRKLNGYG